MKYKTIEIPRPEWAQIGTVVEIKNREGTFTFLGLTGKYAIIKELNGLFEFLLEDLTPVPAWEPTPGEYVAAWDDSWEERFVVDRYKTSHKGKYILMHSLGDYAHVARITGVDCACSVEELKARTDWL